MHAMGRRPSQDEVLTLSAKRLDWCCIFPFLCRMLKPKSDGTREGMAKVVQILQPQLQHIRIKPMAGVLGHSIPCFRSIGAISIHVWRFHEAFGQ